MVSQNTTCKREFQIPESLTQQPFHLITFTGPQQNAGKSGKSWESKTGYTCQLLHKCSNNIFNGKFPPWNRKKKASLQQKKLWRKLMLWKKSGNSPITEPCTWDQGRRNLRSLSFWSDSVLCLQGKETKLRLVEASTTKLQRHVLKMWKELLGWKILLSLARSFALLAIVSYRGWMLRLRRLSLVTKVRESHENSWIRST